MFFCLNNGRFDSIQAQKWRLSGSWCRISKTDCISRSICFGKVTRGWIRKSRSPGTRGNQNDLTTLLVVFILLGNWGKGITLAVCPAKSQGTWYRSRRLIVEMEHKEVYVKCVQIIEDFLYGGMVEGPICGDCSTSLECICNDILFFHAQVEKIQCLHAYGSEWVPPCWLVQVGHYCGTVCFYQHCMI